MRRVLTSALRWPISCCSTFPPSQSQGFPYRKMYPIEMASMNASRAGWQRPWTALPSAADTLCVFCRHVSDCVCEWVCSSTVFCRKRAERNGTMRSERNETKSRPSNAAETRLKLVCALCRICIHTCAYSIMHGGFYVRVACSAASSCCERQRRPRFSGSLEI